MKERKYTYRIQWLVLTFAALLLLLLMAAWIMEGSNREWRKIQKEYAGLPGVYGEGMEPERGIFQVDLPQFNRVDRCITCHNGIENSAMEGMPQPHATHPGTLLDSHPVRQYGCTICHGGQGRALSREDAFGQLPATHWPSPLLGLPYIQSSCGKCHLSIFSRSAMKVEPREGMEVFIKGKTLFSGEGCLGCHKARGVGGILGPDLTRQGEKTKHEYSFQNVSGEQSVSNWLKEHFKDPEMVSPGSQMLQINLEEQELEALATFVMGLSKPDIPVDYFSIQTLREFKGIRDTLNAVTAYASLCSACHGKQGEGKGYEEYETGRPSIGNRDFLRVASRDFIRFTMKKGRSLRQMSSWATSISGIFPEELDEIAESLKSGMNTQMQTTEKPSAQQGNTIEGLQRFEQYCATCHGVDGSGGLALALNQEDFLSVATDRFILETIRLGRANTAMPAWGHLPESELANLLAALRSWGKFPAKTYPEDLPEPDEEVGALRYHYLCSRCHGEFGEGQTGPSIMNTSFLSAASDDYLYRTIAGGRSHTAMFGWSSDVYNQDRLARQDISNIIGYMRTSADQPLTYIFPGGNPGDRESGEEIFRSRCSECHGQWGEGIKAPALNNQEFLSAASNGYIMATITLGRQETAMPSWGYAGEGHPGLSGKERQDLVAWIRSWQRIRIKF